MTFPRSNISVLIVCNKTGGTIKKRIVCMSTHCNYAKQLHCLW